MLDSMFASSVRPEDKCLTFCLRDVRFCSICRFSSQTLCLYTTVLVNVVRLCLYATVLVNVVRLCLYATVLVNGKQFLQLSSIQIVTSLMLLNFDDQARIGIYNVTYGPITVNNEKDRIQSKHIKIYKSHSALVDFANLAGIKV
jgi:hypothetical protein